MVQRIVAVDVDGTLLRSDGTIAGRTRLALGRAIERGALVVVATGRRWRTAQPILEQLALPYVLVSSQGAAVWQDGEVIFHSHLPSASARAALDIIRRHDMATVILGNTFQEEAVWVDGDWQTNARLADYVNRNKGLVRELDDAALDHDPLQFIVMETGERLERLDRDLTGHQAPPPSPDAPAEPGPSQTQPLWRVIFSKEQFTSGPALEVVGPTTSKASALAFLCGRYGLTPRDVIAFGDNVNDLEMLQFAGVGVAMGNATPDAVAAADRLAPTNDEDGIAVVLEELGLA